MIKKLKVEEETDTRDTLSFIKALSKPRILELAKDCNNIFRDGEVISLEEYKELAKSKSEESA